MGKPTGKIRIAVLLSGSGTSLENLFEHIDAGLPADVVCVLSSKKSAFGLQRAEKRGVPAIAVPRWEYPDVGAFNDALHTALAPFDPGLICLLGFLSPFELRRYDAERVLNVHPSLIPAFSGKGFYGHHVHEAVPKAGVKLTGAAVHFASDDYDDVPILLQRTVPVEDNDTVESLAARVQALERKLLPEAIRLIAARRVREAGRTRILPDESPPSRRQSARACFSTHHDVGYDRLMAHLTLAQKCEVLGKTRLFESLSETDLEAIAKISDTRSLNARDELFHQGDEGAKVYFIAKGQLKVITTSTAGDDLMFCVLDPGEVIGEVGLLADRPRTATVVAIKNSDLMVIDRRDFRALLRTRPEVAFELLTVLARRLARVSEFVEDTNFHNLPVRLAKKLIDFANIHGVPVSSKPGSMRIDLKLSQEEWGDLVGTTRESVNKQFRAWGREGLIALDKGKVVILELDEIEKLADCVVI